MLKFLKKYKRFLIFLFGVTLFFKTNLNYTHPGVAGAIINVAQIITSILQGSQAAMVTFDFIWKDKSKINEEFSPEALLKRMRERAQLDQNQQLLKKLDETAVVQGAAKAIVHVISDPTLSASVVIDIPTSKFNKLIYPDYVIGNKVLPDTFQGSTGPFYNGSHLRRAMRTINNIPSSHVNVHMRNEVISNDAIVTYQDIVDRNKQILEYLETNPNAAANYIKEIDDFSTILILSNSKEFHERVYARLALATFLDLGPGYESVKKCITVILPSYFNENGELVTTQIVPEASDKVVYCLNELWKLGNSEEFCKLKIKSPHDSRITNSAYLSSGFDSLMNKAQKLGLYNIQQIEATRQRYGDDSVGCWEITARLAQDHELLFKLRNNKDLIYQASEIEHLVKIFNVNSNVNFEHIKAYVQENQDNKFLRQCYNSLINYHRPYFDQTLDAFSNDPLYQQLAPKLREIRSSFTNYYDFYCALNNRLKVKQNYLKLFNIQQVTPSIEKVLYQLVDAPSRVFDILREISNNRNLNLESAELYNAFYLPSGILKCYKMHPLLKNFKLNACLPLNLQQDICLTLNNLLSYKPQTAEQKIIVQNVFKLTDTVNNNPNASQCLNVAKCTIEALNGSREYDFILSDSKLLSSPSGVIELNERVEALNASNVTHLNLGDFKDHFEKYFKPTMSGGGGSTDPEDPDKKKIKSLLKGILKRLEEEDLFKKYGEHIFKTKHELKILLQTGMSERELFNKLVSIITYCNSRQLLEKGWNIIRVTLNGHETEIRCYIINNELVSINAFLGFSNRTGNMVEFLKSSF